MAGRKANPLRDQIIQLKKQGKTTEEIINGFALKTQKEKDYVYYVISEARRKGELPRETPALPFRPDAPNVPLQTQTDTSGLIIESAEVKPEAKEVQKIYAPPDQMSQSPIANNPSTPEGLPSETPLQPVEEEGEEIDLSEIAEVPITIEDRIFARRGLPPLTEEEKSKIRGHGTHMIEKRLKLKSKYGDIINYVKSLIVPVITRAVPKKFMQSAEEQEEQKSDAMQEYERLTSKKGGGS